MIRLLVLLLSSGAAHAAPHADPKLVDLWGRMDEFHAARGIQRAAAPRELKRAEANPGLEKLLDAFLDAHPNTGLLVLKGDTILSERYQYGRTPGHRLASASVAKTMLGMLVGVAVHEKKISSLEDKAYQYVRELRGHPYGDCTIRDLLTMSCGMALESEYKVVRNTLLRETEGGVHAVLEFDRRDVPPGTRFHYNSADSQVLALVLTAAVREPLATYLSDKIWRPMGAEAHATWLLDKAGHEVAFCCINATLRDYARFGMLLANYGALDGKRIIPEGWVKAATTPERPHLAVGSATPNNGYGYQTWILGARHPRVGGDRFAAFGIHGQAIFVDPARKLVVVHTAAWADSGDRAERGAQFKLFDAILTKLESP